MANPYTFRLVKGSELTWEELDANFSGSIYSASLSGNTLTFTTGDETTYTIDLSNVGGGSIDTGSLLYSGSFNSSTNILTLYSADGNYSVDLSSLEENLSGYVQNSATSSFVTNDQTGSFLISASANLNTLYFTSSDANTFSITIDTGSVDTSNFVTNSQTGSFLISASANLNTLYFTSSNDNTFSVIIDTGSVDTSNFVTNSQTGSFLISASANLNTIHFTSSDANTFSVVIDTGSVDTSNFVTNSQTGSFLISASANLNTIHFTASNGTTFSILVDTGSVDTSNFITNTQTGSFLTSGSFDSGTSAITLYSDDTNYTLDLSSLAGGGGGILGIKYNGTTVTSSADMLNFNSPLSASNTGDQIEITINTGSFVTNPQTGSYLVSASNSGGDAFQDITFTKGDGTTFVIDATPNHVHERVINKETGTLLKGTPVYVSGSTGNAVHVYAASASNSSRMPAALILDTDLNSDQEGFGLVIGFINGVNTSQFNAGDNVYVGVNGGYINVRPTGSNIQVQKLGNVITVDASNGSGLITGAGRSNDVPNIQTGYLWVGNEDEVATPIATSSIQNVVSSSYASTASYAPNYVLNSATSSFVTNDQTGSFLISASANLNTIYFTSSDANTFSVVINTGSVDTSNFVTNSQTGSFLISASANLNTLYFTSSDDNTFSVTIDTGSLTEIDTLDSVTTRGNTTTNNITVNQITSSYVSSSRLLVTQDVSFTGLGEASYTRVLVSDTNGGIAYTASSAFGGGSGVTINNNINNNVLTATGGSDIDGESGLTFDGGQGTGILRTTHSIYIQGTNPQGDGVGGLHLNDSGLYYNSIYNTTEEPVGNGRTDLVITNFDTATTYSFSNANMDNGKIFILRNWNSPYSASVGELHVSSSLPSTVFGLLGQPSASLSFTMTGSSAITLMFITGGYSVGGDGGFTVDLLAQISGDRIGSGQINNAALSDLTG